MKCKKIDESANKINYYLFDQKSMDEYLKKNYIIDLMI